MDKRELNRHWGRRLREARGHRDMTQPELSSRSGVSQQVISGIERGERGASDATRIALARALDMSPNDLFSYPDVEPPALGRAGRR